MMTAANMTRPVRLAYDVDIVLLRWKSGQEGSVFSRDVLGIILERRSRGAKPLAGVHPGERRGAGWPIPEAAG